MRQILKEKIGYIRDQSTGGPEKKTVTSVSAGSMEMCK